MNLTFCAHGSNDVFVINDLYSSAIMTLDDIFIVTLIIVIFKTYCKYMK